MLSDIFAINLFGYAVTSNHYHLVSQVVPDRGRSWSDEVIADKWLALFPRQANLKVADQASKAAEAEILCNPEWIVVLRQRLSSLSWFMRCLNEPLARVLRQVSKAATTRPTTKFAQRTLTRSNAPNPTMWLAYHLPKPHRWQRTIGSVQSLKDGVSASTRIDVDEIRLAAILRRCH